MQTALVPVRNAPTPPGAAQHRCGPPAAALLHAQPRQQVIVDRGREVNHGCMAGVGAGAAAQPPWVAGYLLLVDASLACDMATGWGSNRAAEHVAHQNPPPYPAPGQGSRT